ncbi:MAG: glycosyltransferase family 2 protein [Candidatus Omnitrophica bacterium]|nr:glycosyltransferase family 2 protein [Candidatus Omnitrophota bacterium]
MKILVIIPAYNEAGAIARTVREVLASPLAPVVLVVDDGSQDETFEIARRTGARVVRLPVNLGIGGAVQTGYRYAAAHGFDVALQLDGDGQHDAAYLRALVEPVLNGQADLVIGSRFLSAKEGFQSSWSRRLGIRFFRWLIAGLTGVRATDPTSGFRACGKRLIHIFAGYYPSDFPEPEAIVVAHRMGARVAEVPVVMRPRREGVSSIGTLKSPYYMIKVTVAILLHMIKQRKVYGP